MKNRAYLEIDDAGGEAKKRGRGSDNKSAFVAAVQTSAEGKRLFMCLTLVTGFYTSARKH
ncbi:MAG: hypothetical protein HY273_01290 [Gammaproteobacteria bacterium]|nr:hypothetical protein [Gammaproteobacteria bacterium]